MTKRRSILEVIEDILKVLSKEKNLSVKSISDKVNSQWDTTIKALEFLKRLGLAKEKSGNTSYKTERLWSLR